MGSKGRELRNQEFGGIQGAGHEANEGVIRGREESVFYSSQLGVPQEEVQKKPQLGTTQETHKF
jgi:hypothetical protein